MIPAGHVGVIDLFGVVRTESLKSGIHIVNPLARVIPMSIQTQELKEQMEVPSKEGLAMQLEVSALFHLDPEKAPEVYRTVGMSYVEILLEPQFRSVARGVTASYEAKALYTSEREHLAGLLAEELRKLVEPRGITVENTPLRKVGLPAGLSASIEQKLSAEQESQRMEFVLMKERQEADRKRIEAQGVADFQKIVSAGDLGAAAQVEGNRGDDGDRAQPERQGRRHRRRQGRPAADPRRAVGEGRGRGEGAGA